MARVTPLGLSQPLYRLDPQVKAQLSNRPEKARWYRTDDAWTERWQSCVGENRTPDSRAPVAHWKTLAPLPPQ
jgi:hypothetical protein